MKIRFYAIPGRRPNSQPLNSNSTMPYLHDERGKEVVLVLVEPRLVLLLQEPWDVVVDVVHGDDQLHGVAVAQPVAVPGFDRHEVLGRGLAVHAVVADLDADHARYRVQVEPSRRKSHR